METEWKNEDEKNRKIFKNFLDFFKMCVILLVSNSRKEIPLMMNPAVLSSLFSRILNFREVTEI